MCFFRKKKSQTIKFEQNLCNAKTDDNEILFVRVNDVIKCPTARFEVPFTHNAILIKGGGDMRLFNSGTYEVFENQKDFEKWKSGVSVEIIFIPKETRVLIKWGTPNRFRYRDLASNKVITVGARGEFDVSVSDPLLFFKRVVGFKKEFDLEEFRKRFGETVATEFADLFLKIVADKQLAYDMFAANKKEIGESMCAILSPAFENEWGLSVHNFKIADIDLLEGDMQAIEDYAAENKRQDKMKEYLAELERLEDKQWEREKYLRQIELQDNAAYYEVLKVIGKDRNSGVKKASKCPVCGREYKPEDKFCPHCGKHVGDEPIVCLRCGAENESNATFCAECGKKLFESREK